MYCGNCGTQLNKNAKFCHYCGQKIQPGTTDSKKIWYYANQNGTNGPYSTSEMIQHIKEHRMKPRNFVWKIGMSEQDWLPLCETELFQYYEEQPGSPDITTNSTTASPYTDTGINNIYAWALANIPILLSCIAILSNKMFISYLAFALYIVFWGLDGYELQKNGYQTRSWFWTGFVLIPVYLFIRASKTNKQYSYGFTWCSLFMIFIILFFNAGFPTTPGTKDTSSSSKIEESSSTTEVNHYEIEKELDGTWRWRTKDAQAMCTFRFGQMYLTCVPYYGQTVTLNGSYSIGDKVIICSFTQNVGTISYTYESGKLRLFVGGIEAYKEH